MLLEVTDLHVNYGKVEAVRDVSFGLESGEIVALIGPNGAGKSTVLKAVGGLLDFYGGSVANGTIRLDHQDISSHRSHQLAALGVGTVPEGRRVFPSMSVKENLLLGGFLLTETDRRDRLAWVLDLFAALKERLSQKAGTMSGGEQQMVAIGRALMLKPRLLLADEPSLGLSPNYVEAVFDKLQEINHAGVSILLAEQNAREALAIAHRGIVFDVGKVSVIGPARTLLSDPAVQRAFLGA